jgi:hypothetical protein
LFRRMTHPQAQLLIIPARCRSRDVERLTRPLFNAELTPQATAAHRRSARARAARHRKAWGILAEVVPLSPYPSLEEHRAAQRAAAVQRHRDARSSWARQWRQARARLRELPRARALELLDEWHRSGVQAGRRGPGDLLLFLSDREPTEETLETRRAGRLASARVHIDVARSLFSWYVAHRTCPEGGLGVVDAAIYGARCVRCIACLREWRTKRELLEAEAAGELEIVDFRLAEQLDLF